MRSPTLVFFAIVYFSSVFGTAAEDFQQQAKTILSKANVPGGLVVHLGCGDGKLTAALRADDGYLVHGLDRDVQDIRTARRHVQSLGLLGQVSFDTFDGVHLPYASNLVNLLAVSEEANVSREEMQRVLVPGGVMMSVPPSSFLLSHYQKPWPENIDHWTHFLHDASGNAVAHDRVVAAPRHVQWADGPLWSRSHEYDSSLCAMVSTEGRMFSIFDEGPTGIVDPRIPDRWTLIARDAFNGVILWKRPLPDWGWKAWRTSMADIDWRRMRSHRCASPLTLPRRLVAVDDRVYTTLGYEAPVVALDAATGETTITYAESERADEILFHGGRLILCVPLPGESEESASTPKRRGGQVRRSMAKLMAFQADTGEKLWQTEPLSVSPLSLAAHGQHVFYHAAGAVSCIDLTTGRQLWSTPIGAGGVPLVVCDEVAICLGGKQLHGLAATDGRKLWQLPAPRGFGVANPPDLFVIDGLAWFGQKNNDAESITGYDPATGKPMRTINYGPLVTRGHHSRCYRSKATDNYLLLPKRAVEFVDIHQDQHSRHNWVRGACRYGVLPCNGLLYSSPHPCFCYAGVKLGGFMALAPEERVKGEERSVKPADRLKPGPAYAASTFHASPFKLHTSTAWPSYRHDALRSGSVETVVNVTVRPAWNAPLGGRLTQPVVVDGRVFVARVDAGTICCLDATTGELSWDYLAGGRVDSSPTYFQGRLIFGSADGHVYCLRASDGELAWRFRAAPEDRRVVSFGQVESTWPVHGSVLLLNEVAYFTAGRSSYLDGGIVIYGIDPLTGEQRYHTKLDGPHPDATALDEAAYAMEGAKSDLLVSDGSLIYLFHNAFDAQLNRQPTPVLGKPGVRNLGERRFAQHLFSNAGFLDDSWFSRNHWMLGDHWTAFNFAHQAPKEGQLVVFDDTHAYAVKCFARRNMLSPLFFPASDGYFLVADRKSTDPVIVNPRGQNEYVTWLPQEGELQKCWNLDVGFARNNPPAWTSNVAVRIRAMVRTRNALFAAGPPDLCDPDDPLAALEGRRGGSLLCFDANDGRKLSELQLDSPPVFDGLSAAAGRLYLATVDGKVVCFKGG